MTRFARDRRSRRRQAREGSTAVEFALVATPFFFMMFAVLEIAFVFVLDSALENAAIETGRLVRTGQASAQGFDGAVFKSRMCARMSIFSTNCSARLSVDVRELPRFTNPNPPDPTAGGVFSEADLTYQNGRPRSIMLVRAWYRHTLFTPFLHQGLSRMGNGQAVLTAATAFRNEPWE